jgi:hypothetical protein
MKRLILLGALAAALVLPVPAAAFHHGQLPARDCAADAAGSPSNDNGEAKEALLAHNRFFAPPRALPPLGPAGNSGNNPPDNTGDAAAHEECANADD